MSRRPAEPSRVERWQASRPWVLGALLLLSLGGGLAWVMELLGDPQLLPIRLVEVDGEMRNLQRQQLEQSVANAVDGSFFTLDLTRLRKQVEGLAWVDSASVRRVWPDRLKVTVVEQRPLAYWGKGALLNQRGEIFHPEPLPRLPGLPRLTGPDSQSVAISKAFRRMQTLLATVGLQLTGLRVDARQAWRLRTRRGLHLRLGRKSVMTRLRRFVQLYPRLVAHDARPLKQVDLRYTNGFALRREAPQELGMGPQALHGTSSIAGI